MGTDTGIAWTDHTWNPWQGCDKVSPGCKFCYMYRDKARYGQDPATVIRSKHATFSSPLKRSWTSGSKVFTCSWSDWFHEDADAWRDEAWAIIRTRHDLIFQILTKRAENIAARLPADWGDGYKNVWLGVSVENQEYADKRIPILLKTPARTRFVSYEPALGPVDFDRTCALGHDRNDKHYTGGAIDEDGYCKACGGSDMQPRLDWGICGGESDAGNGLQARPFEIDWGVSAAAQFAAAGVAFYMKQVGDNAYISDASATRMSVVRGGADPSEWPASIRIQEFPHA